MKKPDCCTYCSANLKHDCRLQKICVKVKTARRRAAEAQLDDYTFQAVERVKRLAKHRKIYS